MPLMSDQVLAITLRELPKARLGNNLWFLQHQAHNQAHMRPTQFSTQYVVNLFFWSDVTAAT